MAMSECSAYSSQYRRTQRSSLQLGLRVGGHLALTDFRPDDPKRTLTYGWRRMDSIINIAVSISIILVLYQTSGKRMPLAYLIFTWCPPSGRENYKCLEQIPVSVTALQYPVIP